MGQIVEPGSYFLNLVFGLNSLRILELLRQVFFPYGKSVEVTLRVEYN